jgi:hypothetical protein
VTSSTAIAQLVRHFKSRCSLTMCERNRSIVAILCRPGGRMSVVAMATDVRIDGSGPVLQSKDRLTAIHLQQSACQRDSDADCDDYESCNSDRDG